MKHRYIGLMAILVSLVLVHGSVNAAPVTTIRIGHKWDEANKWQPAMRKAADLFEAKNPDIKVEIVAGWTDDKYKVAVATGDAPDAQILFNAPTWAANGFIQPIDVLNAKYSVKREDYVPAAWDQGVWRGKLYTFKLSVDPNFGLFWNKVLFAETGLNPDTAPQTLQEFDTYMKRLTRYAGDGKPVQMGMTPWTLPGGKANTAFTWGWLFGGEWFDYATGKHTAHHSGNIKAFQYLIDNYERYNDAYTILGKGIPTGLSRFTSGREAMQFFNPSVGLLTLQANPGMQIGQTKMFNNPQEGVNSAMWIGGWDIGLTATSKHAEAAYKFMLFLASDPAGVDAFCEYGQFMPSNIRVPYFRQLGRDPQWRVYTEAVVVTAKYRPAVPTFDQYNSQLTGLFDQIIRKEVTPNAALEKLSQQLDVEMTKYSK